MVDTKAIGLQRLLSNYCIVRAMHVHVLNVTADSRRALKLQRWRDMKNFQVDTRSHFKRDTSSGYEGDLFSNYSVYCTVLDENDCSSLIIFVSTTSSLGALR